MGYRLLRTCFRWLIRALLGGLLGAGLALPARAQAWQRDSVLSQLGATAIVPDPAGFLWVSTETGVFRYDGHQAVPFNKLLAPGSPRLPASNTHLLLEPGGRLWCGTQRGLFRFVPSTRRLERVALPPLPNGRISIDEVNPHFRPGHVWVRYGGVLVELAGTRVVRPPAPSGDAIAGDTPGDPHRSGADHVERSLYRRIRQPPPATHFRWRVPGSGGRWQADFGALYDSLTAAPGSGPGRIAQWDTTRITVQHFRPVGHDSTWYWLSLSGQLVALTPQRRGQPPRIELPAGLERLGRFAYVQASANGVLWAGHPLVGTYRFSLRRWPVQALQPPGAKRLTPTDLSFRSILRLPAPDGRLLVACYQGLLTQPADSPTAPLRWQPLRGASANFEIHDLLRTRTGQMLVANERGLPAGELDVHHWQYRPYQWTNPAGPIPGGACLFEDHAGRVWAGTSDGLYIVNTARRTLTRYRDADVRFALHSWLIEQLAEAPAGVLWAATNHGLYRLTVATGELRHYGPDEADPTRRLPSTLTLCVRARHPDSVWVGTRDQGLLLLDPRRGVVRRITTTEGLPNPSVASILPDAQAGVLWLGTFGGLARYSVRTGQVIRFGAADGLAATDLNRQSAWRDPVNGGWVYFGGVGGLTRVAPTGPAPLQAPRLLLTGVRQHLAARDTVLTRYLTGEPPPGGLQLAADDSFLELTLALTDQTSAEPPRYTYRLMGEADRQFRPVTGGYRLRLDHLAPGDYVLELKGQTAHGDGARNVLRVPLRVAGHWWRHPLAGIIGAVLLAGLAAATVYVWQRQRTRRLLREQALRSRIAADLHDEVGALLTRVNLQAEVLHETGATSHQLGELLEDSRAAVATMRDVVWSIDAHGDTIGALLDRMRDHLERSVEPAGWHFELRVENLIDTDTLAPQVRQHLYLIFKEAVTNALRHALHATTLRIYCGRHGRRLILDVWDDGRPHPSPATRSGLGLRSMTQRATALGGTLEAGPVASGGYRVRCEV